MELSPNPERMRYLMRSPRRPDTLKISPRNKYRLKRRERSEEDGDNAKEEKGQLLYRKKKRTEKFVRSATNHRVMTKAELARWEKEVDVDPKAKACADALHRMTLLREKENVEFILNNETFELTEEEISPVPSHSKKRGPKSPLRLELDVSVIGSNNSLMPSAASMVTSFIEPLTPATDISLIVPTRARASASSGKKLALPSLADPLTPAAVQPKRYSRRSKTKPTCQLSSISALP